MKTFLFEWKKLLIYQRGWLVIMLALALKLCYLIATDSPEHAEIELYRDEYMYYMENLKGMLCEEKEKYIETTASLAVAAKDKLSQTYLNFYAGEISETECDLSVRELSDILERYKGMNALYEQYLYVRQQPEERYMLYTNGWAALLQIDELDFCFGVALLILIIQMFCKEYGCKMDSLIMTTTKGSCNHGMTQEITALLLAILLYLLFCIEHLVFCAVKYGLTDANYPLQSLEYFSDCPYSVTLGQTFLILMVLRMFGAIFLAALICFTVVWTRRYAVSCFLILSIVVIPYVSLSDSVQYRLPMPLGFLRAVGYLLGNEVIRDAATGEETIAFSQISELQLLCLCIIGGFLIVLCSIYIGCKSRNKILRSDGKKFVLPVVWLACISVLTGCGGADTLERADVPYNSMAAAFFWKDTLLAEAIRKEGKVEIWIQGPDGTAVNMVRTPFREDYTIGESIYSYDNSVYYISSYVEDDSNIRLSRRNGKTTFRILGVSADTMEEVCIFEISYRKNSEWAFLNNVRAFFLNDQDIWFITENAVRQVNIFTQKKEMLNISVNGNIAYDGLGIYFIDDTMRLSFYDIETESIDKIGDIAAGVYVLTQKGIYFSNLRDNNYLYYSNLEGNEVQKVVAEKVTSIELEGDLLKYYVSGDTKARTIELERDE